MTLLYVYIINNIFKLNPKTILVRSDGKQNNIYEDI